MFRTICLAFTAMTLLHTADTITGFPTPDGQIIFTDAQGPVLRVSPAIWGPDWAWTGVAASFDQGMVLTGTMGKTNVPFRIAVSAKPVEGGLDLSWSLSADADTATTMVAFAVDIGARWHGPTAATIASGATNVARAIPFGREAVGQAVTAITVAQGPSLTFATPQVVLADNQARIVLVQEALKAGVVVTSSVTIRLPAPLTWYATPSDLPFPDDWDRWYPWQPKGRDEEAGAIGLQAWLDAPAGKHGRVRREGDRLMIGDQPQKFWGINLCYATCAPEKALAEKRAAFYAKHGINAVRLHKYADGAGWAGIQSADSCAVLDAEGLDRMDYFVAKLKERGIYVKLSPVFMVKLGAGDREAVPWMDEFGPMRRDRTARVDTKHGSIYLAHELQERLITQMTSLLTHRNPYTGLTYAEDPAIMVVELFNEDSALFHGTMRQLQNVPTLRKRGSELFTRWLKRHYTDEAALVAAWGAGALNSFQHEGLVGESWNEDSIVPAGNPWFYDPDQLAGSQAVKKKRLLDTMRFFYEIQNDFYDRYVAAIRASGYQGEILASNWHAGRAFSHFYNLHSDARIGMIDRHNYQGRSSMLAQAGSGMLSAGMQQVAELPFSLSEWIHVYPNEYGAEGPVLLGTYGMGLQDWDVSFIFQNRDQGTYSERIGRDRWDAVAPQILATFPVIARQILRGDVQTSEESAALTVHVPSLAKGELGFEDRGEQNGDIKAYDSSLIPSRALAALRCAVAFTDEPQPTEALDISAYIQGEEIVTRSGQLRWREGARARVVIDTSATQAVIGRSAGETVTCAQVAFTPTTPWCYLAVTAIDRDGDLATGKRLLITALARARNTGMRFAGDELIEAGKAPVLMEPVVADLRLLRAGVPEIHVLDHDGLRTGATLPVVDGLVRLDGGATQTVWYEVAYPE